MFEIHPRDMTALRLKEPAFRVRNPEFRWLEEFEMRDENFAVNADSIAGEHDVNYEEVAQDREDDDKKMQTRR